MAEERIVVITGCSRGIGSHLAKHYHQRGFRVIGCSRRQAPDDLQQCSRYEHYCLDVSDEHAVQEMFSSLRVRHGRLDALINNAGIASMNHALLTPLDTVRSILETNVVGTFLFCREATKLMRRRKIGRIVNFSSVAAPLRLEGESAYAASKAAIENLTRTLSRELADFGITVNAVGPGPIATDLIRSVPQEKLDSLISRQAIHRFGKYTDVTNVIDFFLQDSSDFVTGQVLYLGGAA